MSAIRTRWHWVVLGIILAVGSFLRADVYLSNSKMLTVNYNYAREGAAISLSKGWGFRIVPIPDYRSTGRFVDPVEYMTWDSFKPVDRPEKLQPLSMNPGPVVLMAGTFWLFGYEYKYYQVIQMGLTLVEALLAYYICVVFFKSRLIGLIGAAVTAVSLHEIYFGLTIGREIHTTLAQFIALAGAAYVFENGKNNRSALKEWGVVLGTAFLVTLFVYFKKTAFPFFLLVPFAALIFIGWRKAMAYALATALVAFLTLSPWMLRNQEVFGEFSLTKESEGLALWGGLGVGPNAVGMNATDTVSFNSTLTVGQAMGRNLGSFYMGGSSAWDQVAHRLFRQYVRNFPRTYLDQILFNIKKNFTSHTEWQYYRYETIIYPAFKLTRSLFSKAFVLDTFQWWKVWLEWVPVLSLLGMMVGLLRSHLAILPILTLGGALVTISLAVSGNFKYITHILALQNLFAAVAIGAFLHLLIAAWRLLLTHNRSRKQNGAQT